jgi:PAS domain S-box-containing protein
MSDHVPLSRHADRHAAVARLGVRAMVESDLGQLLSEARRVVELALEVTACSALELLPATWLRRAWPPPAATPAREAATTEPVIGTAPAPADDLANDWVVSIAAEWVNQSPLAQGDALRYPDLRADAPDEYARNLLHAGYGSALSVPLRAHGQLLGVIGAFSVEPRGFDAEDVSILEEVASILAGAIARHRTQQFLRWQTELANLLTKVSTGFIKLAAPDIDGAVEQALAMVGGFVGADRGHVYLAGGSDDEELSVAYRWCGDGAPALTEAGSTLRAEAVPWTMEQLRRGEVVHVAHVRDLPEEAAAERRYMVEQGSLSGIILPMLAEGRLIGFAIFDTVRGTQPWPDHIGPLLRPIGSVFANAVTRQRMAAALEASERRYRSVLDEVSDVIVRIAPDGRLVFVNRAWSELTGISFDDTIGKDAMHHIHPDDRHIAAEHMYAAVMSGDEEMREVRFIAKGGRIRWMEARGRAAFNAEGMMTEFAGSLHDITERREAEIQARTAWEAAERAREEAERNREEAERAREEAERNREQAERASRAKSEFLSRMSHELRTPLNAILGFSQLLEFSGLIDEDADNLRQIVRAGRHLLDLINDALDVSRIESGRLTMSLEPVQFGGVAADSLDLVRPAAAANSLILRAPTTAAAHSQPIADRQRLKQVLLNLLSNAVKYNRPGGTITMDCHPLPIDAVPAGRGPAPNGWLRITIADTGIGIPADRLDDVFVPFERIGAEQTDIEGTGIGLALTRSLVEAMGGGVGLNSTLGVGTTFHVDLPAAVEATPPSALNAGLAPAAVERPIDVTHTILYVEDNPSNVTLVRRVLAKRPHLRLLVTSDGASGLALLREHRPDLVLLDLHLPVMDGYGVLTTLREDPDPAVGEVPVVIVTADLSAGTERRLMAAGANAFLGKPIDIHRLLQIIDENLTVRLYS